MKHKSCIQYCFFDPKMLAFSIALSLLCVLLGHASSALNGKPKLVIAINCG